MQFSTDLAEIAKAISTFQGKIGSVGKDKTANIPTKSGGSYSYSYADLSSIWDAIRQPLSECGLAVVQMPEFGDGLVYVTTAILHTSGQHIQSTIATRPSDTTPQAIGSAITYLRRYGMGAMLGIVTEVDDDGAAGSKPAAPRVESRGTRTPDQAPSPRSARPAQPQRPASPNREGMIKRIGILMVDAARLDLEVSTKKPVAEMTNEELISHGKALTAAIEMAEAGSPQR
jgi:hypothetical protein